MKIIRVVALAAFFILLGLSSLSAKVRMDPSAALTLSFDLLFERGGSGEPFETLSYGAEFDALGFRAGRVRVGFPFQASFRHDSTTKGRRYLSYNVAVALGVSLDIDVWRELSLGLASLIALECFPRQEALAGALIISSRVAWNLTSWCSLNVPINVMIDRETTDLSFGISTRFYFNRGF